MPHRKGNTQVKIIISYPEGSTSLNDAEEVADDWAARMVTDRRIPEDAVIEMEIWSVGKNGEFTNAALKFARGRDIESLDD